MTTYTAGKHPNSQANLIPWKPGVSPNPKGRPAGVTYVSEWVNALLTTSDNGTSKYRKSDLEKIVDQEDVNPFRRRKRTGNLQSENTQNRNTLEPKQGAGSTKRGSGVSRWRGSKVSIPASSTRK